MSSRKPVPVESTGKENKNPKQLTGYLEQHGKTLTDQGYLIVPIQVGKKAPGVDSWQKLRSTKSQVDDWLAGGHRWSGVGIQTARTPAIDLDIRDEDVAARMEAVVREVAGDGLLRIGKAPKRLLCFRTDEPFRKMSSAKYEDEWGDQHQVEVLGDGQQFVAFHRHPDTGKPYTWPTGDSPLNIAHDHLPVLTVDQAQEIISRFEEIADEMEWSLVRRGRQRAVAIDSDNPFVEDTAPVIISDEELRSRLMMIPNPEDYDLWMNVGMALYHQYDGDDIGLQAWHDWSEPADNYDPDALDRRWPSFDHRGKRRAPLTARFILKESEKAGWISGVPSKRLDALEARFPVIPAHRFATTAAARWTIRGVLPQAGIVVFFGDAGSGKSFFALDVSIAVSRDTEWHGQEVTGGPVVYIAAEGAGGFRKRLRAIAKHQGFPLEGMPLGIISDAPNMLKDDDKALARAIEASGGAVLIVIDTLASVTPGANENSAEDMGAVIARCKRLQEATGATVLLVHHSGKDASRGARGWSGHRGAVDVEIEITRKGDDRLAKVTKQKDGEDGALFPFRLLSVDLGQDDDGVPLTSCVVEHLNTVPEGSRRPPSGSNQQIVFDVVKRLAPCSVDDVLKSAIEKMPHDPEKRDKRRDHAKRALDGLISAKHITCDSQVIRLYGDRNPVWDFLSDAYEGDQL